MYVCKLTHFLMNDLILDNRRRIIRFFRPRPAFRTGLNSFALPERHITVTFTRNEVDCVDDHL